MSEPVALNSSEAFGNPGLGQGNFENPKLSLPAIPAFDIPDELRGEYIAPGVLTTLEVPSYHRWKRIWEVPLAFVLAIPALSITLVLMGLV